jgi:nucleoid-associated protein YgaU
MRYQYTPIYTRFDGSKAYKTTYYPVIPLDSSDIYITSTEGDYLDSLSKKYYNDESFWWVIANANNLGNGKLTVPVGKQIRIPGNLPRIMDLLKNLN